MKKYIYLSTCDTCKRIQKELGLPKDVEIQDIKKNPITEEQVAFLYSRTGSYEALINKRSRQFKALGIVAKECSEAQFKELLFKDYTFLARPILIWDGDVFIGNAKKTVEAAKAIILE